MVGSPAVPGIITPNFMPLEKLEEDLVPASLYGLMRGLLDNLKRGEAVKVLPHDVLLTTQQAAQILNVSRPYLYRLSEEKAVPVVMVGSHRGLNSRCDVTEGRAPAEPPPSPR